MATATNTDSEDFGDQPPRSKKKKLGQTPSKAFLPKYYEEHPCLVSWRKGKHFAHCTVCNTAFSEKHSGLYDRVTATRKALLMRNSRNPDQSRGKIGLFCEETRARERRPRQAHF
eukprot:GHVL01021523.1.p1 GENE.GHVL01021523.1~~GHVL01021523.1.p1  ORF type:complete len:115 (-),score=7.33 GHVL01021523.1:201-545(-)